MFEAGDIGGGECEDCVLVDKRHLSCLGRPLGVFGYIVRVRLADAEGVDPEIGDVELLGGLYGVLEHASESGFHKTRGCGLGMLVPLRVMNSLLPHWRLRATYRRSSCCGI